MNIDSLQIQLSRIVIELLGILLLSTALITAAPPLPADMHAWATETIENIYREKFKHAEEEARKIIHKYPDHPAGYFFVAVALDSWMGFYESNKKEDEFYRFCDLAIEKGEKMLDKNPKDEWAKFFIGGADGYKGTYEARYERWITAFRYGWKGVSVLLDMRNSGSKLKDIEYGIGNYEYWRSALMKVLWWMPGIEDKREIGIKRLQDVRKTGLYTRQPSAISLAGIFLNEKRYKEALTLSEELLKVYPRCLMFTWVKAKAHYGLKQYNEAELSYRYILSRVEAEPFDNHYNAAICHYWIAKINLDKERYTQAIAECNRMGYYDFNAEIKKRLEKYFSDMSTLKKQAMAARSKVPELTVSP